VARLEFVMMGTKTTMMMLARCSGDDEELGLATISVDARLCDEGDEAAKRRRQGEEGGDVERRKEAVLLLQVEDDERIFL